MATFSSFLWKRVPSSPVSPLLKISPSGTMSSLKSFFKADFFTTPLLFEADGFAFPLADAFTYRFFFHRPLSHSETLFCVHWLAHSARLQTFPPSSLH